MCEYVILFKFNLNNVKKKRKRKWGALLAPHLQTQSKHFSSYYFLINCFVIGSFSSSIEIM